MTGAVLGIVAALLLLTTGLSVAATLRLRSLPELLLGAYVVGFAEVVTLVLVLTPFEAVRRAPLLGALLIVCVAALVIWWSQGSPHPRLPPGTRRALASMRFSDALLLGTAGLASLYSVALILGTPPSTWDSLRYHLARAAFWRQDGAVGYVSDAYDELLNAYPPHAEIVVGFALEITRIERAAGFVQLVAWMACAVAVGALARRMGLSRGEAAFGSLLFVLLPIVVLQASTTQNDLVVASFLLAATVFVVGDSRSEMMLAATASALAVGTKVVAVYAIPVLFAVAVMAEPRRARAGRVLALAIGCAAGAYWYAVNAIASGSVVGDPPNRDDLQVLRPAHNIVGLLARVLDALELTGVRDWGAYAYPAAGAVAAGALLALAYVHRLSWRRAITAGVLVFAPFALLPLSYALWRVFAKLHDLLGLEDGWLPVGGWTEQTLPSEGHSWFGPVGVTLVVAIGGAALVLVRRGRLPRIALALALSPLVWLVLISSTLTYNPWQGRFFIYPVALSASLWGVLRRAPAPATAAAIVTVLIAVLSVAQYDEKPLSVWRSERWETQSLHRPEVAPLLRFIEERMSERDSVALALGVNDWGYPAFGPRLSRRVVLVPFGSSASEIDADWLVSNSARAAEIDGACWLPVLTADEGQIFRRHTDCNA